MTEPDEPSRPWTLSSIQKWANDSFPTDFGALPNHTEATFKELESYASVTSKTAHSLKLPSGTIVRLMHIGVANEKWPKKLPLPGEGIYAVLHGPETNHVAYLVSEGNGKYTRLTISEVLKYVDVAEPLIGLCDKANSQDAAQGKLRALVLYYHLAAGLIQSISYYSTFCKEFRMACTWNILGDSLDRTIIQKGGASLPKSAGAKLHRGDEASGRRSKRLRGVEDEEAPIDVSKRQELAKDTSFYDLHTQIGASYAKLEDRFRLQEAELTDLRGHIATTGQDYDIKNQECESLKIQLELAKQETMEARQEAEMEKEQVAFEKKKADDAKRAEFEQWKRAEAAEQKLSRLQPKEVKMETLTEDS